MKIKPLYETQTIKLINPVIKESQSLQKAKNKFDKYGNIPNGIAKVLHWEKIRQTLTLTFCGLILLGMIFLIILYLNILNSGWQSMIIPSLVSVGLIYKIFMTTLEKKYLNNSIKRYSEDLQVGITSTPGFIAKMYKALIQKQIRHNWFTFFIMFYGGIITLLLWWLKDYSWWIFRFDKWIHSWFANPDLMTWIFSISLLAVIIIHMVLAVQRKRRMLEIDYYFGSTIMPQTDIDSFKSTENKMFRRIFIISLMIFLLIPICIKLINKILRKK